MIACVVSLTYRCKRVQYRTGDIFASQDILRLHRETVQRKGDSMKKLTLLFLVVSLTLSLTFGRELPSPGLGPES